MTAVEMINSEIDKLTLSPQLKTGTILVAADGSDASLAALKAAQLIHGASGRAVTVLSVVEPLPLVFPSMEGIVTPPPFEQSLVESQRAIILNQMKGFDPDGTWVLDVKVGRPAETIAEYARSTNAGLIIIGENKHGVLGRMLGEETATEIARLSETPLLIAWRDISRLPKRVLIAMDIDPDGMQHAGETLKGISDAPSLYCVHVQPRSEFLGIDWVQFDREYQAALDDRFRTFEKELAVFGMRPDLVVLHGDIARELADFADYSKAELIVVGIRRRRGRTRAIGGRMARKVVRQAKCSVLIIPNLFPADERPMISFNDVIHDPKMWGAVLRDFTARNAGRVVSLEVDDPEIGALVEASNYPLIGVDYDHKSRCVTILLGQVHGSDRHLTRTICNARSVSMLNESGRDVALSVAHNGGQTLLTF